LYSIDITFTEQGLSRAR